MKINPLFYLFLFLPLSLTFGYIQKTQKDHPQDSVTQRQPNILWVLTDDQRYDAIRAFNNMLHGREMSELGYVESPNVDRLATQGVTYINTYCQAMVCAPSRASMHTGRYPFRSGIYQFEYFNNNTDNSYPLLPEAMAKLGYQTAHFGKLGVRIRTLKEGKAIGYPIYQTDVNTHLVQQEALAATGRQRNITEVNGEKLENPIKQATYLKDESGKMYYISKELEAQYPQFAGMAKEAHEKYDLLRKYNSKKEDSDTPFHPGILAGVSPLPYGKTRDGVYNTAFKSFLQSEDQQFEFGHRSFQGADPSKPLFCHIGYDFPHTPVLPPADYRERFQQHQYEVPTLTEEELEKMPEVFRKRVLNVYTNDFTDQEKQKMIQDYYAFCAYGDALVGEAVDAFVKYSEKHDQPWLVVYVCGDHGWMLNDHGTIGKVVPWEVDMHNPIIVVSSDKKKFPPNKVVTDFTEFVDIAPTILDAAGADLQSDQYAYLDGMDLAKVASGELPARDYVIGQSHHVVGPRAYIRTKEYAFSLRTRPNLNRGEDMKWALQASYEALDPSLYYTPKDPHEINNLAFDEAYQDVAMAMKEKLLTIVLGDNRAETNWGGDNYGKNVKAVGTKVYRSNFAPGAHDYKLELE